MSDTILNPGDADRREDAPVTWADMLEMAQKFTPPTPRELHVSCSLHGWFRAQSLPFTSLHFRHNFLCNLHDRCCKLHDGLCNLHVRNRQNLVRITGAHERVTQDIPPSLPFAGIPVYCDDAMPNNVMEMRHAETGEVLRRWFLTPDGELFSFNPGEFRWRDEKFGRVQP